MSAIAGTILTIGHSTHELGAFVALLRGHGIACVVDVRMYPGSRRLPHFAREALAAGLAEEGIGYLHVPELGGRRRPRPDSPNEGWRNPGFRGYADHMASVEFRTGIEHLERAARGRRTAVMCAEGLWWRCHRRLVADALVARGWEVLHVAPDGGLSAHELAGFAAVEGGTVRYPPAQGRLT